MIRLRRGGFEIDRTVAAREAVLGQFQLKERFDTHARRTIRVARLLPCGGRDVDLVPELFDADVLYAAGGLWTVRGSEREEAAGGIGAHEQSWVLRECRGVQIEDIESELAAGREPRFIPGFD